MHNLTISWAEGSKSFTPADSPVLLGRSLDCSVVVSDLNASREHVRIRWTGDSWLAEDISSRGCFDADSSRLSKVLVVDHELSVRLGDPDGPIFKLAPTAPEVTFSSTVGDNANTPSQPGSEPAGEDQQPPAANASVPPSLTASAAPQPDSTSPNLTGSPSNPASPPPDTLFQPDGGISTSTSTPNSGTATHPSPSQPTPNLSYPGQVSIPEQQAPPVTERDPSLDFPAPASPPSTLGHGYQPPAANPFAATSSPPMSQLTPNNSNGAPPYGPTSTGPNHGGTAPIAPSGQWAYQPATTVIHDGLLRLEVDNQSFSFQPHQEVTIGRDESCLVTLDMRHSLTSRRHVRMQYRDGAWWMEDFSSKGTFVDGYQIKNPYKAEGGFKALLGNKQAGTEIKVIAPGEHKPNRRPRTLLFGAIALACILLLGTIAAGVIVTRSRSSTATDTTDTSTFDPENQAAAFREVAKQSTVLIVANLGGEDVAIGSGFFISEDLLLTNQHVVAGVDQLQIAVSDGNDQRAQLRYVAAPEENHPFLDIAVIRLTGETVPAESGTADESLVGGDFQVAPLPDLPDRSLAIADGSQLVIGDEVFNSSFATSLSSVGRNNAGNVSLPPVAVASGEAASFDLWPGCDNPIPELQIPVGSPPGVQCNPEGDTENAVVTTTFTSGPGASGSPVFEGEEVVAVVYSGSVDVSGESNAARAITSQSFKSWLDPILAAG